MQRFVLCRPKGGLNDSLVQIERCWRYAAQYDRTLVIDSTTSGMMDKFENYFVPALSSVEVLADLRPDLLNHLNAMSVRPTQLSGRLRHYEDRYSAAVWNFVEAESGTQLSFDLTMNHEEHCLVHQQCGGGIESLDCLSRLRFTRSVAASIGDTLNAIGDNYLAVHVRNTDYRTDFRGFFKSIASEVTGKRLLVCSDDAKCIDFARTYFRKSEVFTVSRPPDTEGKPLHYQPVPEDRRFRLNVDMFTDLLALSLATKLFTTEVRYPRKFEFLRFLAPGKALVSGFSRLAQMLNANQEVARNLLAGYLQPAK